MVNERRNRFGGEHIDDGRGDNDELVRVGWISFGDSLASFLPSMPLASSLLTLDKTPGMACRSNQLGNLLANPGSQVRSR